MGRKYDGICPNFCGQCKNQCAKRINHNMPEIDDDGNKTNAPVSRDHKCSSHGGKRYG